MAMIKANDQQIELSDGAPIRDACEELGVLFGCREGLCGTCMIDILEGEDNLSELTEEEVAMDRDREHRLACQTKIKKGTVTINFDKF
ncbi:(2Fe-2S)-binding protein [Candidatus Woesearchaeota archaeon]|nr:(2Fe-2S)-binding protein [Candidatus Woesearchaeota archaeon]MBI2581874.1 (2Fe-2S)-binding protein [Candidatus Woesearchaeota archaeon]